MADPTKAPSQALAFVKNRTFAAVLLVAVAAFGVARVLNDPEMRAKAARLPVVNKVLGLA